MTWSETKLTWESRTEQEAKPRGLSHWLVLLIGELSHIDRAADQSAL